MHRRNQRCTVDIESIICTYAYVYVHVCVHGLFLRKAAWTYQNTLSILQNIRQTADKQAGRQTDTGRQADRQTGRQADRQTDTGRQADRQTGRQTDTDTDRHRQTYRQTDRYNSNSE